MRLKKKLKIGQGNCLNYNKLQQKMDKVSGFLDYYSEEEAQKFL